MSNQISIPTVKPQLDRDGVKRLVSVVVMQVVMFALMFLGAQTFNWTAGWLYVTVSMLVFIISGVVIIRRNPAIINERGRPAKNIRPWDRAFGYVYAPAILVTPLVAGLDYRFGWSTVSWVWQLAMLALLIPAMLLPYWTMLVNDYLTMTVQIQTERGHHVVDQGPYRFVRHPMYLGAILVWLLTPMALGSWWALIPGGIAAGAMIIRTVFEDQVLQSELKGYKEFTSRVRYRLLPSVW